MAARAQLLWSSLSLPLCDVLLSCGAKKGCSSATLVWLVKYASELKALWPACSPSPAGRVLSARPPRISRFLLPPETNNVSGAELASVADEFEEGEAHEEGGHLRAAQRRTPMEEVRREEDQQHQLPQVLLQMHLQGQHELPGDEAGAAEGPQRPAIVRGHLLQRALVQQRLPPALPLRVPAPDLLGKGRLHLLRLVVRAGGARTAVRGGGGGHQCQRRLALLQRRGAARHAPGDQQPTRAAALGDVPVGRGRRGAEAGVLQHRVPRRVRG